MLSSLPAEPQQEKTVSSYHNVYEMRPVDIVEDIQEVYDKNTGKVVGIGDKIACARFVLELNSALSNFVDRGGKVSL